MHEGFIRESLFNQRGAMSGYHPHSSGGYVRSRGVRVIHTPDRANVNHQV